MATVDIDLGGYQLGWHDEVELAEEFFGHGLMALMGFFGAVFVAHYFQFDF